MAIDKKKVKLYKSTDSLTAKYDIVLNCYATNDKDTLLHLNKDLRRRLAAANSNRSKDIEERYNMYQMYKKTFLFTAHYSFEDYMLYLEINRPVNEQFYRPRMKILKTVVKDLQDLHDGNLQELFISMPPRVGKTTLIMFFLTWLMGINSEKTNLYSSFSDTITHSFYEGINEIINDNMTYTYSEIFPASVIVNQNSRLNTLDLERKKRYPTLTCRSIYGTLNGSCDCNGVLIGDDLIGGIEEALNPERMYKTWKLVDNNLITRAKQGSKVLWIGTRWSLVDPAGLRQDLILNDPNFKSRKYKIVNLPALNENDESNFDYDYGVGFSTEYYQQRRASFERNDDMASWFAQYQGEPVEREGALFNGGDMKFYNGILPNEEPVRRLTVVDTAWGGGDYVSAPIAYQYADGTVYIPDVVFNNGDKRITQPEVAKKIASWGVQDCDVEKNNGGEGYAEDVQKELERLGYKCVITSHSAPTTKAKEVRIFQNAPDIREFYFLEPGKRSKEYSMFMNNLFSFKILGKNEHDDAPDSLSQLCDRLYGGYGTIKEIFKRPC